MGTDIEFSLEDQPGTGARTLTALGQAGINVIGLCAVSGGQTVHLAVEDADAARTRQALESAGVSVNQQREIVVAPVEDRPGAAAAILQRLADADLNLQFLYLGSNTRLIIGAENTSDAQQALSH